MPGQVQFVGNQVLFDNGQVAFDPDCCCGGVEMSAYDCTFCDAGNTPLQYTVVISGIQLCTGCYLHRGGFWCKLLTPTTIPNGTFVLTQRGVGQRCVWYYTEDSEPGQFGRWNYDSECGGTPDSYINTNRGIAVQLGRSAGLSWNLQAGSVDDANAFTDYGLSTAPDCVTEFTSDNAWVCAALVVGYDGSATVTPGGSPFCETRHCLSRKHCATCRDLEGGRTWRESLRKAFTLPDDATDFPCPHGLPWGAKIVLVQTMPAGTEKYKAVCLACGDNKACPNVTACCGGKMAVNIQIPCPRGKWLWPITPTA